MGSQERRARQKSEVRAQILDAARALIREQGYDSVTIRAIASRIEFSPMALYNYFPDKDAILTELAEAGFAELVRVGAKLEGLAPLEALRKGMIAYVSFGLKNPEQYKIVFMSGWQGPPNVTSDDKPNVGNLPLANGRAAFKMLTDLVERCALVDARFKDVFGTSTLLWAGIHGVTSLMIAMKQFPFGPADVFAEQMTDLLLSGLTSGSAAGSTKPVAPRKRVGAKGKSTSSQSI